MIFLLYGAIVLGAIAVLGNLMLHRWNAARRDKQLQARVEAYEAGLAHEGMPEALGALTHQERQQTLLAAARQVQAESDRRFYISTIGGILAFFVALGFAIEGEGTRDFVITLVIAAAALYGINVVLQRSFRSRMEARGIDIERLRID
ncbi:hypothetical protein [Pelagibacterium montanilacus]|uniref:hypothetical protein n=1 Tax=Pelagibacterium montanilacus TaxID=2185280 RepID=UPI000F8C8CC6|nr:hypothetical protein [Pelagibacterium montanilacus]